MQKHLAAKLRCARPGLFPQETLVAEGATRALAVVCGLCQARGTGWAWWCRASAWCGRHHGIRLNCSYLYEIMAHPCFCGAFFVCFSPCGWTPGRKQHGTAVSQSYSLLVPSQTKKGTSSSRLWHSDGLRLNIGWAKYRCGWWSLSLAEEKGCCTSPHELHFLSEVC